MRRALEEAKRAWGETHPNPLVGAVIVDSGRVVAEGFHARAGEPHAEVVALRKLAGKPSPDATLYVTLEPCCTHGRTPPCTEAIIAAGIRNVVVGVVDPNPAHAGKGLQILRAAGINVKLGVLGEACADLNLIFNHWISRSTPLIVGKIATTLDGRIATRTGESRWITGPSAREDVMRWRRYFPAIGVGANTVLADNPRLTSRLGEVEWCPLRFIFDRSLRTLNAPLPLVYSDAHADRTILVTREDANAAALDRVKERGVRVWTMPHAAAWLQAFRDRCKAEGIVGVYLEGGSTLLSSFLHERQLDYLFSYRAPKILADHESVPAFGGGTRPRMDEAIQLHSVHQAAFGNDQLLRGFVHYPALS